jgi:hypothetical protein
VGVDDGSGDFSGDGHAEPGSGDGGVRGVFVAGDGGFAQGCGVVRGGDHFERGGLGIGAVYVVAPDDDVFESLLAPFGGNVVGEFVVAL